MSVTIIVLGEDVTMAQLLIVDDESSVRDLIRRSVEDLGHDIREAENARAALASLAETPADVVFCDVQMPGEDGLWLTGQIRNAYPMTAVVLATAVSTVAPSVSMQAGVMAYLVKPFSRVALLDALATALDWHERTKASGPRPEDVGDRLKDWLDSLEDI
jgi:DNA-binding NtrC family response regulator